MFRQITVQTEFYNKEQIKLLYVNIDSLYIFHDKEILLIVY